MNPNGSDIPTASPAAPTVDAGATSAVAASRPGKSADSEKITINLGFVDLGQIDLLVNEGFYGNRSDFIRTAIRNQLTQHGEALKQVASRKLLALGMHEIRRSDLLALQKTRQKLTLRVVGLARIADDVSPELALDTIEALEVLGALQASDGVRQALKDRLR